MGFAITLHWSFVESLHGDVVQLALGISLHLGGCLRHVWAYSVSELSGYLKSGACLRSLLLSRSQALSGVEDSTLWSISVVALGLIDKCSLTPWRHKSIVLVFLQFWGSDKSRGSLVSKSSGHVSLSHAFLALGLFKAIGNMKNKQLLTS